jgi:hypothetical protein
VPYDEQLTRLVARFGTAVVEPWRARLPTLLDGLATDWGVKLGTPVGRGNTHDRPSTSSSASGSPVTMSAPTGCVAAGTSPAA